MEFMATTLFDGHLAFPSVLIYLASYFLFELAIKNIYKQSWPQAYEKLRKSGTDARYFAFLMGIFISAASTPFCYTALKNSTITNDSFGSPSLPNAGQICIASRSVLWISELNRLDYSTGYLLHHFCSLGYLVYHMYIQLPMRIIYAFYTSLATELFSDSGALMALHGLKPESSLWTYRIQTSNTILLVVLRIPPMIYAVNFLSLYPVTSPFFWIHAVFIILYAAFILNIIYGNTKRLKIVQCVPRKRGYLRLAQRFEISIYCIFFSIASFVAAVLTSRIYLQISPRSPNPSQFSLLNLQLLLTGLCGTLGARAPSLLSQSGYFGKTREKPTLWIQGSILAMAISVFLAPLVDRQLLLVSMALALPISEAIGRIGCYFAGCCGGNDERKTSLQLLSTSLNSVLGFTVLFVVFSGLIEAQTVAAIALGGNAFIRILLRPNIFAFFQIAIAVISLYWNLSFTGSVTGVTPNRFLLGLNSSISEDISEEIQNYESRLSQSPWTVSLALAAVAAGCFVQKCNG